MDTFKKYDEIYQNEKLRGLRISQKEVINILSKMEQERSKFMEVLDTTLQSNFTNINPENLDKFETEGQKIATEMANSSKIALDKIKKLEPFQENDTISKLIGDLKSGVNETNIKLDDFATVLKGKMTNMTEDNAKRVASLATSLKLVVKQNTDYLEEQIKKVESKGTVINVNNPNDDVNINVHPPEPARNVYESTTFWVSVVISSFFVVIVIICVISVSRWRRRSFELPTYPGEEPKDMVYYNTDENGIEISPQNNYN